MTGVLLDAGALIAIDRGERSVGAALRVAWEAGVPVHTTAPVVAQVWRGGPRQARLARILTGVTMHALSETDARRVGVLLGEAGTRDVVDAHLAVLATPGDAVFTSDRADLERLLRARAVDATIVSV